MAYPKSVKKLCLEIHEQNPDLSSMEIAKEIWENHPELEIDPRVLRRSVSNWISNGTKTETNQYEPPQEISARKPDGSIMDAREFCEFYGLPYNEARSYKLLTHKKYPSYNIASHNINDEEEEDQITLQEVKDAIAQGLKDIKAKPAVKQKGKKVSVLNIADLHFGAYVDNLKKTKKFSIEILADYLRQAADIVNEERSDVVHVNILGDLIESFTGLNHKNSWKGIEYGMTGAEVVKACTRVLHTELFSRIDNLGPIKVVGGNHDRLTSDKTEDVEAGAANLICWGLDLLEYDIEFDPFVINTVIDGISYILMHGDKSSSKRPTSDICWDYGDRTPGIFNVILEGHLHTMIQKLNVKQVNKIETIKDSSVDSIRILCHSLFTGNMYSEHLGYTSLPGILITRNNGAGIPHLLQYSLRV